MPPAFFFCFTSASRFSVVSDAMSAALTDLPKFCHCAFSWCVATFHAITSRLTAEPASRFIRRCASTFVFASFICSTVSCWRSCPRSRWRSSRAFRNCSPSMCCSRISSALVQFDSVISQRLYSPRVIESTSPRASPPSPAAPPFLRPSPVSSSSCSAPLMPPAMPPPRGSAAALPADAGGLREGILLSAQGTSACAAPTRCGRGQTR